MSHPPEISFRWNLLETTHSPINLASTLRSGQSFRWRKGELDIWWGTIESTGVVLWQESGSAKNPLYWQTFPEQDNKSIIIDYLALDIDLDRMTNEWLAAAPDVLGECLRINHGLRILRQPPQECFFAFQCASCNTVVKIERSVAQLAQRYGCEIPGLPKESPVPLYAFPTLEALANADDAVLRSQLWGYRAPRVIALAKELLDRPEGWLESLRSKSYDEAHTLLSSLHGIGPKIADCICLFSLDKHAAVPVDTHVRQVAERLFLFETTGKSLTPTVYQAIRSAYISRFGEYAGWAQQYFFFVELGR